MPRATGHDSAIIPTPAPRGQTARWIPLLAALAAAALYAAACPPFEWSLAAWAVPGVLLVPARRLRPLQALLYGVLFSMVLGYLCAPWVAHASLAYFDFNQLLAQLFALLVYFVYIAIPCALLVLVYSVMAPRVSAVARALLAAWLWACSDLLRAHLFTGLPYELLGHSQFRNLLLVQIADVGGVYAVSFVIALVSVACGELVADLGTRRPTVPFILGRLAVPVAALAAVVGYGVHCRFTYAVADEGVGHRVAVIQGNVANAFRWKREYFERTLSTYLELTREVRTAAPDLIVWPENAVNFYIDREPGLRAQLGAASSITREGLLVGGPRLDERSQAHNSVYLLGPNGKIRGTYDKRRLVPFAEYNPLPWFDGDSSPNPVVWTPGTSAEPLGTAALRIGTLICYEVLFPHLVRDLVHQGADVLVNLSNDSWLDRGDGVAPRQHFSMSIFRAIETRRYLVRASSSGVSGFVNPYGETYSLLASDRAGTAVATVFARHEQTPYTVWGDSWLLLGVLGCAVGIVRYRHERPVCKGV